MVTASVWLSVGAKLRSKRVLPNRLNRKEKSSEKHVVIIGGGFAGINAAKGLANARYTSHIVDRQNHHLFQPLLHQVAMAAF